MGFYPVVCIADLWRLLFPCIAYCSYRFLLIRFIHCIIYANINFQIVSAYENGVDSEEMKRVLKDIGEDLQKGVYSVNQYLPGAEVYA